MFFLVWKLKGFEILLPLHGTINKIHSNTVNKFHNLYIQLGETRNIRWNPGHNAKSISALGRSHFFNVLFPDWFTILLKICFWICFCGEFVCFSCLLLIVNYGWRKIEPIYKTGHISDFFSQPSFRKHHWKSFSVILTFLVKKSVAEFWVNVCQKIMFV